MNTAGLIGVRQFLLYLSLLFVFLGGAVGCASTADGSGASSAREDIMTSSDESEARKRARIRLELAVGYFEQGKTTIALDELKQSIASDPTYAPSYNLRGLIYMRLDNFGLSEDSFKKALTLNSRDSNVMHNFAWLLCQQARYAESSSLFLQALANPQYGERAKTHLAHGLCQARAGLSSEAEVSLMKSYELDAGNPITAYNLAALLYQRSDYVRSQFYVRRLNNSELANSESLWLGVKVERKMDNRDALRQLAGQLEKRFPQSREALAYQRGAFDE